MSDNNAPTSQSGYAGQQQLNDGTSDFNKVSFLVNQILSLVRTATLVQVQAVTNDGGVSPTGTVDVLPLVNMTDGAGNATPHITVYGLPYCRVQGGLNAMIVDPIVGDIGIAVFSDRDISSVKVNKKQANPGSRRRFNFADGVYLFGVMGAVPTQYIRFTSSGIEIVDKNGNMIQMTSAGITMTDANGNVLTSSSMGFSLSNNLAVTGTITATGEITRGIGGADSVTLGEHKHGTGTAAAGTVVPTAGT